MTRCGMVLLLAFACLFPRYGSAFEPLFGNFWAHDPSRLIKDGNRYYFFRTSEGIESSYSTDLRNWTYAGRIFPGDPPAWTTNAVSSFTGHFWAPDVAYFNGRYHVYYSVSEWGTINSAIGLVTSPSLISPVWTDQGKVIQSDASWEAGPETDLTANNCIDPAILSDSNGSIWMVFGSYSDGILVTELNPATGKRISANSPITKVADNGSTFFSNTTEAAMIFQRGAFYYLFLNFGGCCSGVNSTYNIRVGRSTSVTGPYFDRSGINMLDGGGTMLLESTGRFIGPGHPAIHVENGTNWFTYHYYDGNDNGAAKLGLAQLHWTADDWPALTNDWSAFYTFDADAREHLGRYNGAIVSGASITNTPDRGGVLSLGGTTNHVLLPHPVANASTFAAWVKWKGGGDWQRIFDFGTNTSKYAFLTPRANNGRMRFAIRNGGAEQIVDAPAALPANSWAHVAVTLDGSRGSLFLNGDLVASSNNITIRPWQLLARSNYVGESQFAADPGFNGEIDSLRIFGRALSAGEVRDLAWAHPALAHRYSFTSNGWDSIGMAHGKLVGNASITNHALRLPGTAGSYVNLPGGLVSGSRTLTIEFWASFGAIGNWARVFDFGNINGTAGQNYLFYTPHSGNARQQIGLGVSGPPVNFESPPALDDRTVHIACIIDPANGYLAIYTNSLLQSQHTAALPALTGISSAWAFLGRSLFSADAWLNATIDEFRIYDGRLAPGEIRANFISGPDALALPVTLAWTNTGSSLSFSWPAYAVGFGLQSAASLDNAVWSSLGIASTLANDEWRITIPLSTEAKLFRLKR